MHILVFTERKRGAAGKDDRSYGTSRQIHAPRVCKWKDRTYVAFFFWPKKTRQFNDNLTCGSEHAWLLNVTCALPWKEKKTKPYKKSVTFARKLNYVIVIRKKNDVIVWY
jgi:hypothetical protein